MKFDSLKSKVIFKAFFESVFCKLESLSISKTFRVKSESVFTKNQFCQSLIISFAQCKSKAITGTQIDIASIIVIQNESILEVKRQTSDFSR
ncbi:hypothetical protein GW891_03880 [bacterium]|nr:hypothetical protein [bacterium]